MFKIILILSASFLAWTIPIVYIVFYKFKKRIKSSYCHIISFSFCMLSMELAFSSLIPFIQKGDIVALLDVFNPLFYGSLILAIGTFILNLLVTKIS